MKACFFYALRQLRRKPREFFALIMVSAAILTALIMFELNLESQWRCEVLPESDNNYHFQLYDLTPEEMEYVEEQPYVLYVKYRQVDDKIGDAQTVTCVRVLHELSGVSLKYCRALFDRFDLWSRPHYVSVPHYIILRSMMVNQDYYLQTATPYVFHADVQIIFILFALFMSAAVTLLLQERYKRSSPEFGTLRALGMTKTHIYYINVFQALLVQLCALPVAAAAAVLFGKIFTAAAKRGDYKLADNKIFIELFEHIPVAAILYIFVITSLASAAGAVLVCALERGTPILGLLNQTGSISVSYVAKTSDRFAHARSAGPYRALHLIRTRRGFILNAAVIMIVLPLPMFFYLMYINMKADASLAGTLTAAYYGATALILLLTAFMLSLTVAGYFIRGRKRELAILRSLGAKRTLLFSLVMPEAAAKFALASFAGHILTFYVYYKWFISMYYDPSVAAVFASMAVSLFLSLILPALVFVFLPGNAGSMLTLTGSTGRSIITNMRETE